MRIRTKQGEWAPFHFNEIQIRLAQHVAWRWHYDMPIYVIVPKARQMGVSTFWEAVFFSLCVLSPLYRAAVVAHEDQSALEIFGITRGYHKGLPDAYRLDMENEQQGYLQWVKGCSFWVGTIKTGDALAKGPTLNAIHFSEAANFSDKGLDPFAPVASAMGALAKNEKAIVVYESTAKGKDSFFFEECERARKGTSGYTLLFLPWYLMPDYRMSWGHFCDLVMANPKAQHPGDRFVPTAEEEALREKVYRQKIGSGEELFRHPRFLDDEQLIWRRWVLMEDCKGKLEVFQRYYPSTYEEAFASTEHCLFDEACQAHYRERSRQPKARGNVYSETGEISFVSEKNGHLRIWEFPVPGEDYVIGADPAEGLKRGDGSSAYVLKKYGKEAVAALYGQLDWEEFARALYDLGWFYQWALVVPENNVIAVASALHKMNYPNLYYYEDDTKRGGEQGKRPGWSTNRKTRPLLVNTIDQNTQAPMHRLRCYDIQFVREMANFVWQDDKQHYAARRPRKDDRIMSMALALYHCPEEDDRPEVVVKKHSPAYQTFLRHEAMERADRRRGSEEVWCL